jgi:hypothetical protein
MGDLAAAQLEGEVDGAREDGDVEQFVCAQVLLQLN